MSFVDELERGLVEAGRRRRRPELGTIVAAASALVAVAIAIVALGSFGHASRSPVRSTGAPRPADRALVSMLAALRRAQTPADRALADRYGYFPIGWGPVVPALTRRVGELPGGERVYLVVSRPPQGSVIDKIGLVVDASAPGGVLSGGLTTATALAAGRHAYLNAGRGYHLAVDPRAPRNLVMYQLVDKAGQRSVTPLLPGTTPPHAVRLKLLAQINLVAAGHPRTPAGVAQVVQRGRTIGFVIVARGVPASPRHTADAVWICHVSIVGCRLLGFVNPAVRANGRLRGEGVLPRAMLRYGEIVISLERTPRPRRPHWITLFGLIPRL